MFSPPSPAPQHHIPGSSWPLTTTNSTQPSLAASIFQKMQHPLSPAVLCLAGPGDQVGAPGRRTWRHPLKCPGGPGWAACYNNHTRPEAHRHSSSHTGSCFITTSYPTFSPEMPATHQRLSLAPLPNTPPPSPQGTARPIQGRIETFMSILF